VALTSSALSKRISGQQNSLLTNGLTHSEPSPLFTTIEKHSISTVRGRKEERRRSEANKREYGIERGNRGEVKCEISHRILPLLRENSLTLDLLHLLKDTHVDGVFEGMGYSLWPVTRVKSQLRMSRNATSTSKILFEDNAQSPHGDVFLLGLDQNGGPIWF